MQEVELKFQVPRSQRAAVEAAVAGTDPGPRMRLQAAYFDTAQRALAAAGLALRMRREGRRWVQTLKGSADDAMTRFEHNVERGSGAETPRLDPELHAATPVGQRLLALLAHPEAGVPTEQYRTDIWRRTRVLRTPLGRVELAFDVGRIFAAQAAIEVLEVEFELVAGSPQAVLDLAQRWTRRFGLWLDTRTKAERGDLLARGLQVAEPLAATAVALDRGMDAASAWQGVLRSCAGQILANASQIAAGGGSAEHVHQLRIGLRRLRSGVQLFRGAVDAGALQAPAARLFRRLGAARDRAVLQEGIAGELQRAMGAAGVAPLAFAHAAALDEAPEWDAVRDANSQEFLLLLLAAMHDTSAPPLAPKALRQQLRRRLDGWHTRVVADARRHAELDDAGRHALRKRVKRLRYASEFCAGMFDARGARRYLRALRRLQDRLGACTDATLAIGRLSHEPALPAPGWFALGWLIARRDHLVDATLPALRDFVDSKRFW